MARTVVWSFLGLVVLASSGLIAGCDSDAAVAKSGEGESCDRTSDCEDGLRCINQICAEPDSGGGNEGGQGSSSGGSSAGPAGPALGGPGESCTRRSDCQEGLGCFNQRCQEDAGGVGGGAAGPSLGGPGETCGLTSDCESGLACLPVSEDSGPIFKALGSVGVCTPIDSGLEPTGATCGAECAVAADCCELPIPVQAATTAKSCVELALLAENVPNCDTAIGPNGAICLAYSVYCDGQCGANTWACEAGRCQYAAKCTKAGNVIGGCPSHTRAGFAVPACNLDTTKCEPAVVPTAGCETNAQCNNQVVADDAFDTCVANECVCQVETGLCYRGCTEDTDCPVNYRCDTEETNLCIPEDSCTSDAFCVTAMFDIRAKCVAGACTVPCENDIDCNAGGLTNGFFTRLCGPDNTCVPVGCTNNDECGYVTGSEYLVKSFCVVPEPAPAGVQGAVSAITD